MYDNILLGSTRADKTRLSEDIFRKNKERRRNNNNKIKRETREKKKRRKRRKRKDLRKKIGKIAPLLTMLLNNTSKREKKY